MVARLYDQIVARRSGLLDCKLRATLAVVRKATLRRQQVGQRHAIIGLPSTFQNPTAVQLDCAAIGHQLEQRGMVISRLKDQRTAFAHGNANRAVAALGVNDRQLAGTVITAHIQGKIVQTVTVQVKGEYLVHINAIRERNLVRCRDDRYRAAVRSALDGILDRGVVFAQVIHGNVDRYGDGGFGLHEGVALLVDVQRVVASACRFLDLDGDGILVAAVTFLAHNEVIIRRDFLHIGVQLALAIISDGKRGRLARCDVCRLRGDGQIHSRCGRTADRLVAEFLGGYVVYLISAIFKLRFFSGVTVHGRSAVKGFACRFGSFVQRNSLFRAGDGHICAIKIQRALYAHLRAADIAGAADHIQAAVNGRLGIGRCGHGECAAVHLDIAFDRAVRQCQVGIHVNAAGDAMAAQINGHCIVNFNVLADVTQQGDRLAAFCFTQRIC